MSAKAGNQRRRRADQQIGLRRRRPRRPRAWPRIRPSRPSGRSFSSCRQSAAGWRRSCRNSRECLVPACASRAPAASSRYRLTPALSRFNSAASRSRLRRGGCHFMMRYQLGDALLRNSTIEFALGATRFPPAKTSWTHASRNAESLIKLARQDHHGRGDGRFDRQFRGLGHRRHLQGIRPVDAGHGRPHRDFDRAIPPDLHRQAAAARPPVRPSADAWIRPAPSASTARCCSKPSRKPPSTRKPGGWGSASPTPRPCA